MKIFSSVAKAKVPRTGFNLSHERKFSMDFGRLTPILCEEVVPGDHFKINSEMMVRLAPMVNPVMHRVNAYVHYFFVPNRIIWDQWEEFITGETELQVPNFLMSGGVGSPGTLGDYMGLPQANSSAANESVNALPFMAYIKIWNEYYRDQNLQTEMNVNESTALSWAVQPPPVRAWEKDYFTSSLPWAQKGAEVRLPLDAVYSPQYKNVSETIGEPAGDHSSAGGEFRVDNAPAIMDNLEDPQLIESSMNINEFRLAHRLQRWLEKNARAGSRYTEHLLAHWGVKARDSRLQRPEYLGGGKTPIVISEVLNNTALDEGQALPLGQMAGHGIGVGNTNKASKYCEEHGFIIGIMSVLPNTHYQQGLHRKFSRLDNLDYYYPEFARLGEQAVLNKEIFFDPDISNENDGTFGYQARYAELRYIQSTVHGEFKASQDDWHMGRIFEELPALNADFITADQEEYSRVFAVQDDAKSPLWVQVYNSVNASRPLPYYNDPTI